MNAKRFYVALTPFVATHRSAGGSLQRALTFANAVGPSFVALAGWRRSSVVCVCVCVCNLHTHICTTDTRLAGGVFAVFAAHTISHAY